MSNNNFGESKRPSAASTCAGIGCSVAAFIPLSIFSLLSGGGGGMSYLWGLLLIGLIVFFIVRAVRGTSGGSEISGPAPMASQTPTTYRPTAAMTTGSAMSQNPETPVQDANGGLIYSNPICVHRFAEATLKAKDKVSCPCGNQYKSADLFDYANLNQDLKEAQDAIRALTVKIRDNVYEHPSERVAASAKEAEVTWVKTSSSTAAAANTAVVGQRVQNQPAAKPVKTRVEKPKVALSLQQWLIIGAAILVLVAGSVFVSSNLNTLPQEAFLAVTLGVGAVMGFLAFRTRSFSVLLSNFLATFSSSMLLATMSIVGDQLDLGFRWDTMPAWWWTVSLIIVSLTSTALARFGRNFAWKAIAVLTSSTAFVIMSLGVVYGKLAENTWPLHLALLSATSAVVLLQTRYLRSFGQPEVKDKALEAYSKDLGEREDSTLRLFALFATALQLLVGVGVSVTQFATSQAGPVDILSTLALTTVWVGVAFTAKFYSGQLSKDGALNKWVMPTARQVAFISVGVAIVSAIVSIPVAWAANLLTLVSIVALVLVGRFAGPLRPTLNVVTAGVWTSTAFWLLWGIGQPSRHSDQSLNFAWFAIGLTLVLSFVDWYFKTARNHWASVLSSGIGILTLTGQLEYNLSLRVDGWATAGLGLLLLLAPTAVIFLRWFVAKRADSAEPVAAKWIGFVITLATMIMLWTNAGTGVPSLYLARGVPLALAFLVYALGTEAVRAFTKLREGNDRLLRAHTYAAQIAIISSCVVSIGLTYNGVAWNAVWFTAAVAAMNLGFGYLLRSAFKVQLGYFFALAAFFDWQWIASDVSLPVLVATQLGAVAAISWGSAWLARKADESAKSRWQLAPIAGIGTSLVIGTLLKYGVWTSATVVEVYIAIAIFAVFAIGAVALSELKRFAENKTRIANLRWAAIFYAGVSMVANVNLTATDTFEEPRYRLIVTLLLLSAVALRLNAKRVRIAHIITAFGANLAIGWTAAALIRHAFNTGTSPEPYSVLMAISLVVTTLIAGKNWGRARGAMLIDVPVIGAALTSLIWGLSNGSASVESLWREIVSLAVITALCYWRARNTEEGGWPWLSFVTAAGSMFSLAALINTQLLTEFKGPEIYSSLVAAAVAVSAVIVGERIGGARRYLQLDVPVLGLAATSLIYAWIEGGEITENLWREIVAMAIIAVHAYRRSEKASKVGWLLVSYLAAAGSAWSLGSLIQNELVRDFDGPEIHSVLMVAAILAIHRFALPHLKLNSSWVSWGLPVAALLLPSTFFTYGSLATPFAELSGSEIARIVAVLVASAALLVFGVRKGNLANSALGLTGLALLVIPNAAFHSNNVVPGTDVEITALMIGAAAWGALALARMYGKLKGNSVVFIGIPVVLVLAPALVRSLLALGSPELGSVDWFRFGIVLAAGLTLLIVGSLRELAGMFYPGLISVILTVLPYGFRQSQRDSWFLWVLLLLVAGVMVWIAMRLEKMRKAGRSSSAWLKSLK